MLSSRAIRAWAAFDQCEPVGEPVPDRLERIEAAAIIAQRDMRAKPRRAVQRGDAGGAEASGDLLEESFNFAFSAARDQFGVRRQNIWRNSRRRLAECRPRLGD